MTPGTRVRVRWAGTVVDATVVRAYKNGRVRVEFHPHGTGWDPTGRFGTVRAAEQMTVEAWQIVAGDQP